MGKLERAKIYVLDGDGEGSKKADPPGENGIDVCFNPKEYSLEKSVSWDTEKSFTDAPKPEFTKPSPMTLSVTLQFDTYEERVSVRNKYVKHLEKLVMMRGQVKNQKNAKEKQKASPPVILFVWGRFTFKGVIDSLSQKYTMFLADGTPVRAEASLKIRNVFEGIKDDDTKQVQSQSERSYTVKEGDRLDGIAAEQMGDASRWPELAMKNNIDNPSEVPAGKTLKIPE
jgi:nucleoid-associated protein YgaU